MAPKCWPHTSTSTSRELVTYGDRLRNHALFNDWGTHLEAQSQPGSELVSACRRSGLGGHSSALDPDDRPAAAWSLAGIFESTSQWRGGAGVIPEENSTNSAPSGH